ncbi:transglutaminase family protein [soil metagenome]
MTPNDTRRSLLAAAPLAASLSLLPTLARAQAAAAERRFDPQPTGWRTFELTTTFTPTGQGPFVVWVPVPSIDADWQKSLETSWTGNARSVAVKSDGRYGAKMVVAEFDADVKDPTLAVTSRVKTMNRREDWKVEPQSKEAIAEAQQWTHPTELLPTDGIVRKVAQQIVLGARTDVEKVQRLYDWILVSTYREPKVRGCGTGDIKTALETQNFGGKCADINGLFIGFCRAVGVPGRDLYGLRITPSAFGYRELGGNPASLKGAQHCRAEVFLKQYGWVAMDPADVTKVMRQETSEWIKDLGNPLIVPVRRALFGGWEGNWLAYNDAADVRLPGATGKDGKIGFFMYPQAQTKAGMTDSLDPDAFKYTITSKEI